MDSDLERYGAFAKAQPGNVVARELYGYALERSGRRDDAACEYEAALRLDPDLRFANLHYAQLLNETGHASEALEHLKRGYKPVRGLVQAFRGGGAAPRVVQLGTAKVLGETETAGFLTADFCETSTICVQYWEPLQPLPLCDAVFNAIADPDTCGPALDIAEWLLQFAPAAVINPPGKIRRTGRVANAQRFARLDGVVAAPVRLMHRDEIAAHALSFPVLLRAPGHHNGKFFERVDRAADLPAALQALPGENLWIVEYLDVRAADRKVRKYRAIAVDRTLYPAHLAISDDWKVHYFSASMGPAQREEEAAYLNGMRAAVGERAYAALERVVDDLDLDYAGIDFAVDAQGRAVVFEANAAMNISLPPMTPEGAYRRPAILRILQATQEMIARKADIRRL